MKKIMFFSISIVTIVIGIFFLNTKSLLAQNYFPIKKNEVGVNYVEFVNSLDSKNESYFSQYFNISGKKLLTELQKNFNENYIIHWNFESLSDSQVLWILQRVSVENAVWSNGQIKMSRVDSSGNFSYFYRDPYLGEKVLVYDGKILLSDSCYNPIIDLRGINSFDNKDNKFLLSNNQPTNNNTKVKVKVNQNNYGGAMRNYGGAMRNYGGAMRNYGYRHCCW